MDIFSKLKILADSAKYDASCSSSGASSSNSGRVGSTMPAGCCHSFSADGRCISLLKVLMSNVCSYDCRYCVNRHSNDVPRATFTPEELAELTLEFYRRNYIEGLFLSSGVLKSPDYTSELMLRSLELLRHTHHFGGYIHTKVIPGTSPELVWRIGLVSDRLSVNIELPSENSLSQLAPAKTRKSILLPMGQIATAATQSKQELSHFRYAPKFATAGQSTQMIVGASSESDYHILRLSSALYEKYNLKRVFYSAYIPMLQDTLLPSTQTKPPLLREHRLYQADFLMRKYHFAAEEILSEQTPNFNPYLDPKCNWAIHNMHYFPVDVNTAELCELLRVPGIGPTSARRILKARKGTRLELTHLKRIGVVLKRARHFIVAADLPVGFSATRESIVRALISPDVFSHGTEQLNFFDYVANNSSICLLEKNISVAQAANEAVQHLSHAM